MTTPNFDVACAHRWFAVELNNLAWQLAEAGGRSTSDTERMIHAAHGACFHWLEVGSPVNHLRAQCLLATAYGKARLPEAAIRHAERCVALSDAIADEQTVFDRATALGCASAAYAVAGRMNDARVAHQRATAAAANFSDSEDLHVFERLYPAP